MDFRQIIPHLRRLGITRVTITPEGWEQVLSECIGEAAAEMFNDPDKVLISGVKFEVAHGPARQPPTP